MFERVYFVLCPNFHGATLLGRLLDAHPQVTSLGDTYPSNHIDQVCGCGEKVSRCEYWQTVKASVAAERHRGGVAMLPYYPEAVGFGLDKYLFNYLPAPATRRLFGAQPLAEFRGDYERFLDAVATLSPPGSAVFVDGCKSISKVLALRAAGFRIDGVVRLLRDPYDYVHSSMRRVVPWRRPVRAATAAWLYRVYHRRSAGLSRVFPALTVRYEDLAGNSDAELGRVFRFLGVTSELGTAELGPALRARWHYIGNASLMHFDGTLRVKRYPVRPALKRVIGLVAGARALGYP